MFNVRVKKYLDTEELQIFSQPICSKGDKIVERHFCAATGEIFPSNSHVHKNPFTGELDYYYNMGDPEENLKRSVRRSKSMIYDIAKSNVWEWFFTLTFNPDKVDSFNYSECSKKLSQWLKDVKRRGNADLRYLIVPELHKSGRWHFHGLFAGCDNMGLVDSGHRDKKGRVIYNVGRYKLGFSTVTAIDDMHKVSSYILKYVSKELCAVTKGKKRYWASNNCCKPVIEEYLVYKPIEDILACSDESKGHLRKVFTEYIDVTYLTVPIYTTNTLEFFESGRVFGVPDDGRE